MEKIIVAFAMAFSSTGMASNIEGLQKDCRIFLSGQPYCVSRGNARYTCSGIKKDEDLQTMKKCLANDYKLISAGVLKKDSIYKMCLISHETTGKPEDDSSNCSQSTVDQDRPAAR